MAFAGVEGGFENMPEDTYPKSESLPHVFTEFPCSVLTNKAVLATLGNLEFVQQPLPDAHCEPPSQPFAWKGEHRKISLCP